MSEVSKKVHEVIGLDLTQILTLSFLPKNNEFALAQGLNH